MLEIAGGNTLPVTFPYGNICGFLLPWPRVNGRGHLNNPKVVAVISGVVALYLAWSIFGGGAEAPSSALNAMNWVFFVLALVACIGSVYQIAKGGR